MAYTKQNFKQGDILNASQLNHIENGITKIEQDLQEHIYTNLENIAYTNRGLLSSTGAETSSTTRLSSIYCPIKDVLITVSESAKVHVFFYDSAFTHLSNTCSGDWFTKDFILKNCSIPTNAAYYRLMIGKTDNATIDSSFVENVTVYSRLSESEEFKCIFPYTNIENDLSWNSGSMSVSNGSSISVSNFRIYADDYIKVSALNIKITDGLYEYILLFYDESKNYLGYNAYRRYNSIITKNTNIENVVSEGKIYYVRIGIKLVSGNDIGIDEYSSISISSTDNINDIIIENTNEGAGTEEFDLSEIYDYVDLNAIYTATETITWQDGGLNSSNGTPNNYNTARCRTEYKPVKDVLIVPTDNASVYLYFYNSSKTYLSNNGAWLTGNIKLSEYIPDDAYYYRLLVKDATASTLTASYGEENVSIYGKSADESNNDVDYIFPIKNLENDLNWMLGSLQSSDGSIKTEYVTTRICADDYLKVTALKIELLNSSYAYAIYYYDKDKNILGVSGYMSENSVITRSTIENIYYIRVGIKRVNENALSVTDYTAITISSSDEIEDTVINTSNITNDIPENIGVLNAILNAKQLCEISYTTTAVLPNQNIDYASGRTLRGIPYSSVKTEALYVPNNVSFETFMSAAQNPNSYLYTKTEDSGNSKTYYGNVCSGLVSYCLGLGAIYTTSIWDEIDGMELIENQSAYGLKLCDVLWRSGHVEMVIDITRDNRGRIQTISIARATVPLCNIITLSLDEFNNQYMNKGSGGNDDYIIYRYKYLYKAEHAQNPYIAVEDETPMTVTYNLNVMPRRGEKANYRLGEDVEIDINNNASYTNVLVYKDDNLVDTLAVADLITLTNLEYGTYKVCLTDGTNNSDFAHFIVVDSSISATISGNTATVTFSSANATPDVLYWCQADKGVKKVQHLTDEEIANGVATTTYDKSGTWYIKVSFKTDYGVYSSDFVEVTIE